MENEKVNNFVFMGIPLDALIVSGITSDCDVEVSAVDGLIMIERCDDEHKENGCDCICDDCIAELAESEDE